MRLVLLSLSLTLLASMALAQAEPAPRVSMELSADEAIPGQAVDLRITVLVPTWMPKPVVFPSFEAPNLNVRLPERATNPVSQPFDGKTWSGVTRRYRIMPMAPGSFEIPAQELIVTWADPETNAPREDRSPIGAILITGKLPAGAKDMDPFIGATNLVLTQEASGGQAPLSLGDSITRVVTATVEGTSPMFIPTLVQTPRIEGISTYPTEPVLTETSDRGVSGGTRAERVTYVAQSGGDGSASAISVDWFNLDSGQIETATVEAVPLAVDAPVAKIPRDLPLRTMIWFGASGIAALGLFWLGWRPVRTRWSNYRERRRARYLTSVDFTRDSLDAAIKCRDLSTSLEALDLWAERQQSQDPRQDAAVKEALAQIGAARYGKAGSGQDENEAWVRLQKATRRYPRDPASRGVLSTLPPLNPTEAIGRST